MAPRKITHNTTLGVLSGSVVLKLCSGDPLAVPEISMDQYFFPVYR